MGMGEPKSCQNVSEASGQQLSMGFFIETIRTGSEQHKEEKWEQLE
jgi:hypothetical protein